MLDGTLQPSRLLRAGLSILPGPAPGLERGVLRRAGQRDGKMHGRWVVREADGDVWELTFR